MATIIEVQESKIEHLGEYAEKVVKYGKQLLECLDDMSGEKYSERYGKGRRSGFRHDPEWDKSYDRPYEKEYPRYY